MTETGLELQAVWLTLKLAFTTTVILLVIGTPLAWWLARTRSWIQHLVTPIIALPLVLPPTVLGFYLLILLGPHGWIGGATESLGWGSLAFTFPGLVIGSVIYSLPFVVQPLQNSFESVGEHYLEVAATLRASPLDRFFTVAAPISRHGFFSAAVLGFAHTLGEFGVVLMIGGNIPGKTRVVSIAIYNHVEAMEYTQAHYLAGAMVAFSFLILLGVHLLNRRLRRIRS